MQALHTTTHSNARQPPSARWWHQTKISKSAQQCQIVILASPPSRRQLAKNTYLFRAIRRCVLLLFRCCFCTRPFSMAWNATFFGWQKTNGTLFVLKTFHNIAVWIQYLYAERIRCLSKSSSVVEHYYRHRDSIICFFCLNVWCIREKLNQRPECVMSSYEKTVSMLCSFTKPTVKRQTLGMNSSEEIPSMRICSSDLFSRSLFPAPVIHFVSDNLKCDRLMWSRLKILHHTRVLDLTQEVFTDRDIIVCPFNQFPSLPLSTYALFDPQALSELSPFLRRASPDKDDSQFPLVWQPIPLVRQFSSTTSQNARIKRRKTSNPTSFTSCMIVMSVPIFCCISCGFGRFVQRNWENILGKVNSGPGWVFLRRDWADSWRVRGTPHILFHCDWPAVSQWNGLRRLWAAHRVFVLNVATWRRSTQRLNPQNLNFNTPNTKISTEHWSLKPEHTPNLKTLPLDSLWRFKVFVVLRVYALMRKFTLTCFLGCVMRCCAVLTLMTVKSSVCGVRWCLYVVHALCCAELWCLGAIISVWTSPPPPEKPIRFGTLPLPHDDPPPSLLPVCGLWRCNQMLEGKPWRPSHCELPPSRRLGFFPSLRAEHRRADRALPTLSTKTWCSSEKGFRDLVFMGVQVQSCLMLFRCAERFGVVAFRRCWEVSTFRRKFRCSRVRGFKGVG